MPNNIVKNNINKWQVYKVTILKYNKNIILLKNNLHY